MLESSTIVTKRINCLRHRGEPVTHICVQTKCQTNSTLCSHCFAQHLNRHFHYDHEKNILPFEDAVNKLCSQIKSQSSTIQKLYKSNLGKNQYSALLGQIQNGQQTYTQIEQRVNSIKSQVQLQMEIMVKELQRLLTIQKQQYFKLLDNYLKIYVRNIEYLKLNVQNVLQFNNQLKFYGNKNNFQLKVFTEGRKKSDWLQKTKRILQNTEKIMENGNYSNYLNNLLNSAVRIKLDIWPSWKKDQSLVQKNNQIRNFTKRYLNHCVQFPQIKVLQEQNQNGNNFHSASLQHKGYTFHKSTSL